MCFIGSADGREGFLSRRVELHPAEVVDGEGRPAGSVQAVELVTVGQRRGMGHGSDGKRRYVTHVDVAARRVTVGQRGGGHAVLGAAGRAVAHLGRPAARLRGPGGGAGQRPRAPGALHASSPTPSATVEVIFDDPQRPVAPGQTVALYDALDPDAVVGAGIAA